MSKPINDGLKAFLNNINPTVGKDNGGISLRDWFAGQALSGICSQYKAHLIPNTVTDLSYELADAMLAAREAKS